MKNDLELGLIGNCSIGALINRQAEQKRCDVTCGSNHIRFISPDLVLRLTTDASITMLREELPFFLDDTITLIIGSDETIPAKISELVLRFQDETLAYWHEWVRDLGIPFEWQDEVIRAAITLKLNTFEDTGAIVAAMTTSIPEAAGTPRTWDYRFCCMMCVSYPPMTPGLPQPLPPSKRSLSVGSMCTAMWKPTILVNRKMPSRSAPSGISMPWQLWDGPPTSAESRSGKKAFETSWGHRGGGSGLIRVNRYHRWRMINDQDVLSQEVFHRLHSRVQEFRVCRCSISSAGKVINAHREVKPTPRLVAHPMDARAG